MPDQAVQSSEPDTEQQSGDDRVLPHSFWKSLPGILTAGAGVIAALSGLLTGLTNAGYIGRRADPVPHAVASPIAEHTTVVNVPKLVSPVEASSGETGRRESPLVEFQVGQISDGFAMVRRRPTTASEGMAKLPSGSFVRCGEPLRDVDPESPRRWRFCPEHDGYISVRLLERAMQ